MNRKFQNGFIIERLVKGLLLLLVFGVLLSLVGSILGGMFRSTINQNNLMVDTKANGVVVGFFNGVNTAFYKARLNQDKIWARFGDKTSSDQPIQYQLFYNDSYGLALDIDETFRQRAAMIGLGDRYDLFWDLMSGSSRRLERAGGATIANDLVKSMTSKEVDYLWTLQKSGAVKTSKEHHQLISQLTGKKSKQRLVLVAHSQGNLYALPAYSYAIKRSKNVSIVHTAPPLDTLKGEFTLSSRDVVINLLREFGRVPTANIDPPPCGANCADALGHGFAEVYFNQNTEAGQKTAASITKVLK